MVARLGSQDLAKQRKLRKKILGWLKELGIVVKIAFDVGWDKYTEFLLLLRRGNEVANHGIYCLELQLCPTL